MKFFDFLQDVTLLGVVVALSFFLIDQPADIAHADSIPDAAALSQDAVNSSTNLFDDLVDSFLLDKSEDAELPNDLEAPAPFDLDELERSLDKQLGRGQSESSSDEAATVDVPLEPSDFLPNDFDSVELREDPLAAMRALPSDEVTPAIPSKPLSGVNRGFDDTDLFDHTLRNGDEFGTSAPEPTRRLGPVEILSPPSEY